VTHPQIGRWAQRSDIDHHGIQTPGAQSVDEEVGVAPGHFQVQAGMVLCHVQQQGAGQQGARP